MSGLFDPEPARAADPVIAAAGDIACGPQSRGGSCREKATSDILVSLDNGGGLSAVLPLGDIQYECGELSNFRSRYDPTWGRVLGKTHPVIGNHEYSTAPSNTSCESSQTQSGAPGYFRYYGQAATPLDPSCTAGCRGYYSFDLGSWHLIALNSNCSRIGGCSAGSAQERWLRDDLARTNKSCILGYMHAPRYSSGGRQTSSVQGLWEALYDARADVLLTGHDHTYERFAKAGRGTSSAVDPVPDSKGIRQFVVGTGGRNHTSFTTLRSLSEVRNSDTFGVLRMTLRATSYEWRFIPESGKTFSDSGTTGCNAKAGSPPSDRTPPTASISQPADGATVTGTVAVSATASDDVGVADVQFKLDGANLGAPDLTAPYSITWDTSTVANGSHTLTAVARDAAGNTSLPSTVGVTVDNPAPPPSPISLVRQATGTLLGGTTLAIPVQPTAAGSALVASIAIAAGSSKSVTGVTDSAGGSWVKGPVGFQSGSNTRIELWYRAGVPAGITSVNAALSASGTASANVSEWSGVVTTTPLDGQAGRGNPSSTTASTPSLTTVNADDVVIGALNYSGSTGATLTAGGFTPLSTFSVNTTNGRAAYRIVSNPGTHQASWTLPAAAASGTAILALKGNPLPPPDTTPPTVTVTNPAPGNVSGTVQLRADALDEGSVAGVRFEVDSNPVGVEDMTAPYTADWDTSALANGSVHAVTAIATDAAGNSATSAAVSVTVDNGPPPDTTPPTVSVTAPQAGSFVQGTVPLAASASDTAGVASVEFKIDGVSAGTDDTSPYEASWDTSGLAEGSTHTVTAVALDVNGNSATSSDITVTVDTTDPTVSVTNPADGDTVMSPTLTATASDVGGGGVVGVQFRLDSTIDIGAEDTAAPYEASWDTSALAEGSSHTITAVARDAAGNNTESAPVSVTVTNVPPPDTTPPTVSVTAPLDGAAVKGSVPVRATASDNRGVVGVRFELDGNPLGAEDGDAPYSVDWDTAGASEGAHAITAVARDAAGNETVAAAINVTVDNTAPSVTITAPDGLAILAGSVSLEASALDTDGSGVASVQFKLDGAELGNADATDPYSMNWDTTTAANGLHLLSAVAVDTAGNVTSSAPVAVEVFNPPPLDATNPTVSVSAPSEGDNVRGTVALAATADDNAGVVGVQFTVNGQDLGAEDSTAPYTGTWDTATGVADGLHTVVAVARDAAGNTSSDSVQVTVDNTAPTASITNPAPGPVSGTVSVQADAGDPGGSGVDSVRFELDGASLGSADSTAPYSTSWDTTQASTGTHTLQAIATDKAGNATPSASVAVTVDNAPPAPAVSFVRQATASISSGTSLRVPVGASAAGDTLVASIAVATGGSKSVVSVSDSAGGTWTKGPVGFLSGSNTRIELWFRTGAPAGITTVTATLSAGAAASANVSEWSGVASTSPVDAQAARGNASSTLASTPSVTTSGAGVVIGAVNYLGSASSTLTTSGLTALTSFSVGTVNGRAAYRIVSAPGSQSAAWALASAAPSGAAILALKAG
jgi:hypothetical protein